MLRIVHTTLIILIAQCGFSYCNDSGLQHRRTGSQLALLNEDGEPASVDGLTADDIIKQMKTLGVPDLQRIQSSAQTALTLRSSVGGLSVASNLGGDIDPTASSSSDDSVRIIRTSRSSDPYARLRRIACCACAGTAIAMGLAANLLAAGFVAYIGKDLLSSCKSCSSQLNQVSDDIGFAHDVVKTVKAQCPSGLKAFEENAAIVAGQAMTLITESCTGSCNKNR